MLTGQEEGILRRDGPSVFLTNLDASAYLLYKGIAISKASKVTRFKYEFVFYDPEGLTEQLVMDFVNSESQGFADAVRRLKNVIHKFYGRDDKPANNRGNGSYHKAGNGRCVD